jgi:hypothetical protein
LRVKAERNTFGIATNSGQLTEKVHSSENSSSKNMSKAFAEV